MKRFYLFRLALPIFLFVFFSKNLTAQADLSINVSSNSATYAASGYITFDITVKNLSANPATGIHCNIPFPTNLSGNSCNHATIGYYENYAVNGTVSGDWKSFTDLAGGDCAVLRFKVFVQSGSSFTISATVSSDNDPNSSNNFSSLTVNQGAASPDNTPNDCSTPLSSTACPNIVSLSLAITTNLNEVNAYIGNNTRDFPTPETVTYSINLTNSSPKNATNVQVQVNLPAGLTVQSSANGLGTYNSVTGIWTIATVVGSSTTQLFIVAYANSGGSITATGQITAVDQPDANSHTLVSTSITALLADLSITTQFAAGTPAIIRYGDVFTVVTTLTNNGPTRADGVKVKAFIPPGLSFVSASSTIGQYWTLVGVWLLDSITTDGNGNHFGFTIPANSSQTLSLTFKATSFGSTIFDTEVRSSNTPDPNSVPSNMVLSENDEATLNINVNAALPIELVTLTAKKQKTNVELNWQTLLEAKLTYFDIEKSFDGLDFKAIGTQKANNKPSEYIFIDNDNAGSVIYYRLNINELDGTHYYSKIISMEGEKKDFNLTNLFPNPADKILNIEWQSNDNLPVNFILTDLLGRTVLKNFSDNRIGINRFSFDSDFLPSGFYFLNIEHNGTGEVKQFVKK